MRYILKTLHYPNKCAEWNSWRELSKVIENFPYHHLDQGGVYMLCAGERVEYVGEAQNYKKRFQNHDKLELLKVINFDAQYITIKLIPVPSNSKSERLDKEMRYIDKYQPRLNGGKLLIPQMMKEKIVKHKLSSRDLRGVYFDDDWNSVSVMDVTDVIQNMWSKDKKLKDKQVIDAELIVRHRAI